MGDWLRLRAARKRDRSYYVRLYALIKLRDQARHKAEYPAYEHGETDAWRLRAITALIDVLGEFHSLTDEIAKLWEPKIKGNIDVQRAWREKHWRLGAGILDTAITSYTFMNMPIQDSNIANALDPDLIARVEHVLRAEDWTAVASLAATFVED
jgi:hypothetical protein